MGPDFQYMLFGNYLNIWKLVFIWTNLDLKPVLKKTNFKLVLFRPNFFSFYFISSHYYFSHFIPINSFSIDLNNHSPPLSTTIRRRRRPPSSTAIAVPYRLLLTTADDHSRYWLPPSVGIDDYSVHHCLSLFTTAVCPVLHCLHC